MYYNRYLKMKLELSTLRKEIEVLKHQQDKLVYSGVRNVSAVDYEQQKGRIKVESITSFYNNLVEVTALIREKEALDQTISQALKDMEKEFKEYAKKCNDIEMKLFIEMYVNGKMLKDIYIPKNEFEYYSIRQIKRIHKQLKEKIEDGRTKSNN